MASARRVCPYVPSGVRVFGRIGDGFTYITWSEGARLSEMNFHPYGEQVVGGLSTLTVPAGYAECWEVWAGIQDFPVEAQAWSAVKALYR